MQKWSKILFSFFLYYHFMAFLPAQEEGFQVCDHSFLDIHRSGMALNLSDEGVSTIHLPFDFHLGNITTRTLQVSNNGAVFIDTLDVGDLYLYGSNWLAVYNLPSGLYPYWANVLDTTGNVYWEIRGIPPHRYVIIEWYNRPLTSTYYEDGLNISKASFEVILYEDNQVEFRYGSFETIEQIADWTSITPFTGIRIPHYTFNLPHSFPYIDYNCVHWQLPDTYGPLYYMTTENDCHNGWSYVSIHVDSLYGAQKYIFRTFLNNNFLEDTVTRAPATLRYGPINNRTAHTFSTEGWAYWENDSSGNAQIQFALFRCRAENDEMSNAIDIPIHDSIDFSLPTVKFDTYGATRSSDSLNLPGVPDDDIWFQFTPTSDSLLIALDDISYSRGFNRLVTENIMIVVYGLKDKNFELLKISPHSFVFLDSLQVGQPYYVRLYQRFANTQYDYITGKIFAFNIHSPFYDTCPAAFNVPNGPHWQQFITWGASDDYALDCFEGHQYRDIVLKAQIPPKQYIRFFAQRKYPHSHYKVRIAYGESCPGNRLIECDTLADDNRTPGQYLSNYPALQNKWINLSDQTQTAYILIGDTIRDGSTFSLFTYMGCAERPHILYRYNPQELDRQTILVRWNYPVVDPGTFIRWTKRRLPQPEWQYTYVPSGTDSIRLSGLEPGAYHLQINRDCGISNDFTEASDIYACISYHSDFTEDFEHPPYCWKFAEGDPPLNTSDLARKVEEFQMDPYTSFIGRDLFIPDTSSGNGIFVILKDQWQDAIDQLPYENRWLISPRIILDSTSSYLSFDVAVTRDTLHQFVSIPENDTLSIHISLDDGNSWHTLQKWDHDHWPRTLHQQIDLSNYTGHAVRIAFVIKFGDPYYPNSSPTESSGFKRLYLDNIMIGRPMAVPHTSIPRIHLYPNPVHDMLHWQSARPVRHAQIWSLSGRLLRQWQPGSTAYTDVSSLPAGVYLLRLQTGDGQVWIHFFIKE